MSAGLLDRLSGSGTGATLARGSLGAFATRSAGLGLALAPQLLLTRLLGSSNYGIYTVALNWVWVLVVLAKFGQDSSRLRFLPTYRVESRWGEFRGLLRWSAGAVLLASSVAGLGLAAVVWLNGGRISPELGQALLVGVPLIPVLSLTALNAAALQALKKIVASDIPRLLGHILLAVLAGAALLAAGRGFSGGGALALTLLSSLAALGVGYVILRRNLPEAGRSVRPAYLPRVWLSMGLGMLAVSGQFLILNRIDILMLKFFVPASEVGVYGIAVRLALIVPFGLEAVSTIAAPMISELYAGKRLPELRRIVHLTVSWSALISLGIFIVLALGGKYFLGLFGPEYPGGWLPLVILGAGQLFNALTGPSGLLLSMTGRERQLAFLISLALCLNALLNWLLIPRFGLTGAALATAAVTVLWNTATVIFIRRTLGIYCIVGLSGLRSTRE